MHAACLHANHACMHACDHAACCPQELDWPLELLRHPDGEELWVEPSAVQAVQEDANSLLQLYGSGPGSPLAAAAALSPRDTGATGPVDGAGFGHSGAAARQRRASWSNVAVMSHLPGARPGDGDLTVSAHDLRGLSQHHDFESLDLDQMLSDEFMGGGARGEAGAKQQRRSSMPRGPAFGARRCAACTCERPRRCGSGAARACVCVCQARGLSPCMHACMHGTGERP
jgi:hypothetical protein